MEEIEKKNCLKLEEMRFQYTILKNNYSRLINKCSFSMLGICVILGEVMGFKGEEPLQLFFIAAIALLLASLVFLIVILIKYKQPLITHQNLKVK